MRGDLTIRKVRTASGAIAVQIIRHSQGKRIIVRHIGSSHTDEELAVLCQKAEIQKEQLSLQSSLFSIFNHPPLKLVPIPIEHSPQAIYEV